MLTPADWERPLCVSNFQSLPWESVNHASCDITTGPRPRFLAPALFGKGAVVAGRPAHRFGKPRTATAAEAPRQVLLAGCKDYETSMDAYLSNGYHGALTYHAVRILQEDPYLTWREVAARLRPRIACCSPQTPQAEGAANALDSPVFT